MVAVCAAARNEKTVMSSITSVTSKAIALARVQALIVGTHKHFPNGQFLLGNTSYTTASLVQTLESLADALTALNDAHAKVKDGVAALRTTDAKVSPVIRSYTSFIRAAFIDAAQLDDFGIKAHKARRPLDTDKRAVAKAKLKATRTARGTKSKKQRLAVKGDVTGVVLTPVTAPAHASPTAMPAAPAPVATTPSVATKQ
jgi:hypothetical protein